MTLRRIQPNDFNVIKESGLPASEVYNHPHELESIGMIKFGVKVSGAEFRLVHITTEGISALRNQNLR